MLTKSSLASRQRKKKHTEDLEERVSDLNAIIANLQTELRKYEARIEADMRDRSFFQDQLHHAELTIEGLRQEKENMVIQHTQVTSNLRQRMQVLEEAPVVSPAPAMSLAPSSSGYTDVNPDLDQFSLGTQDWNDQIRLFNPEHDWELIADECASDATVQPSKLVSPAMQQGQSKATESKDIPTGVLFMLLLCGAFVAANSAAKSPVIPRMSDEVRAVSDTVLNNLLQDTRGDTIPNMTNQYNMDFSDVSGNNWASQMPESNSIAHLHRQLTSPTRNQLIDQAATLTPEQYNALTQPHYDSAMNMPHRPANRNLAEILGNMRQRSITKGSTADVYTRSLLWDQVPENVVKQFKQAVQDSASSGHTGSSSTHGESSSHIPDYKMRS